MFEYIMISLLAALCVWIWALWANDMTCKRRIRIIWKMHVSDLSDFSKVSYDAHLWRVFTFRDPMKLYPAHFKDYV